MDKRALIQDRLSAVEGGNVGALEEFPDGNLIAPEQRFFHGGHPVRGVMRGVVDRYVDEVCVLTLTGL